MTSYKGIKEAELRPGQFIGIVGAAGGLGHLAVQYAKAMGLRPIAVDVGKAKGNYCRSMGAEHYIDVATPGGQAAAEEEMLKYTDGGAHGMLCLATNPQAFSFSTNVCRRRGCVVCCGLPPGGFNTPIFDLVLKRVTIRGSIVGTRQDLTEALDFASRGLVRCSIETKSLDDINDVFSRLKKNEIQGRTVIKFGGDDVKGKVENKSSNKSGKKEEEDYTAIW